MTHGIHHVTAMCGDPQTNVDFYSGLLGLRMVKVNVNMDDPGTYHFYYGDRVGSPGSAMTFFPRPNSPRGVIGRGQVSATAFSVPIGSLEFWQERLSGATSFERFGERGLRVADPDGMVIELIEAEDPREPWLAEGVNREHAIRGFHSVTLWSENDTATAGVLTGQMSFRVEGEEGGRTRYVVAEGLPHQIVEIEASSDKPRGRMGTGTHHHVAFRVADDEVQAELSDKLRGLGIGVTDVQERFYFRSTYFREPGHVLFELATDQPGFTADEPVEHLGEKLCLPPWFEPHRAKIEAVLPKFALPTGITLP